MRNCDREGIGITENEEKAEHSEGIENQCKLCKSVAKGQIEKKCKKIMSDCIRIMMTKDKGRNTLS